MPMAFDRKFDSEVQLDTDADSPAETRPTFIAPVLTGNDSRRVRDLHKQAVDCANDPEKFRDVCERLAGIQINGWRNVTGSDGLPAEFKVSKDEQGNRRVAILDVLSDDECVDLSVKCWNAAKAMEWGTRRKIALVGDETKPAADAATAEPPKEAATA